MHEQNGAEQKFGLVDPSFDKEFPVAHVEYQEYDDDLGPQIDIDYIKSHREGQGNARTLMEGLYSKYPKHYINWGKTINPASTHLAEQFNEKYGRTDWEPEYEDIHLDD